MTLQISDPTAFHAARPTQGEHFHIPDYLVGIGFRARLLMLANGDRSCLRRTESYYETVLSPHHCNDVLGSLVAWTLHIDGAASRRIAVHSDYRRDFSKDEALAIAATASAQHCDRCDTAMLLTDLLGERACEGVVDATVRFAATLEDAGLVLSVRNAVRSKGRAS